MKKKHKHKWKYQINIKKKVLVLVILGVSLFVGLGYAILGSNLGIFGTLEVSKYNRTLYAALKREVNKGYAKKYIGEHQDSMDSSKSTEDIYHFYAEKNDSTKGEEIRNKFNVVFADQCWQMIRTTDTGGVKLLYNGEPEVTEENGDFQYNCGDDRNPFHLGIVKYDEDFSGTYTYAKNYNRTKASDNTTTFTLVDDPNVSDDTYTVNITAANAEEQLTYIAENYPYTCKNTNGTCTVENIYFRGFYKVTGFKSGTTAEVYIPALVDSIGTGYFNDLPTLPDIPTSVGYMYGDLYENDYITGPTTELRYGSSNTIDLLDTYKYSKTINRTGNTFTLSNPILGSEIPESDYSGYYTFKSNSTVSGSSPYYVVGPSNGNSYYYALLGRYKNQISSYNMMLGTELMDNGNGTYTLINEEKPATEVTVNEWYENYEDYVHKYTCGIGNSDTCSDPIYIRSTTISTFTYAYENHYFGTNVIYENGKYVLQNAIPENEYNHDKYSTYHYLCPNENETECSTVGYIYDHSLNYIKINNSDITSGEDALYSMIHKNTTNSSIKNNIDEWYEMKLKDTIYESKLDDTIYCNDRSFSQTPGKTFENSPWNSNGGSGDELFFKNSDFSTELSCINTTDQFSISNNKAKLTYPIALITAPEINLVNQVKAVDSKGQYYTLSPVSAAGSPESWINAGGVYVYSDDLLIPYYTYLPISLRPAISLVKGTKYSGGDGSMTNPYVVDMSE